MIIPNKNYDKKEPTSRFEDGLNKRPKEDYRRKPKNIKQLNSWLYEEEEQEEEYEQFEYYSDNN